MPATAKAHIGRNHYHINITSGGNNTLIADEPEENGGKNKGFSPSELLISALGACTCATLRMYADRKEMKLEEVKVDLSFTRDEENNITHISRHIELIGQLSTDEKHKLLQIANKCPIHKALSNPIHIETKIV